MTDKRNITNTANITGIRKIIDCKFSVTIFENNAEKIIILSVKILSFRHFLAYFKLKTGQE